MPDITCPSGMKLEIRGLKGKELSFFHEGGKHVMDRVLSACVLSVVDPGPYKQAEDGSIDWDTVLLGDKFFTVLQIRVATYGDDFEFKTQCGECRERIKWELKLSSLPVKKLNDKDREDFQHGRPLVAKVPSDGRPLRFRLATGKDEKLVMKAKGTEGALVKLTALRIVDLDGETDRRKIETFVEECSLSDLMKLLKELDKRDCGVETTLEIECDKCGARREMTLPLGREFWLLK